VAITVLKIKALPEPIDNENWVEIEYSCSKCDKSGTVRVPDGHWRRMVGKPMPTYLCAKCGGRERGASEKPVRQK
jgi:uncharacterized protein YlaI